MLRLCLDSSLVWHKPEFHCVGQNSSSANPLVSILSVIYASAVVGRSIQEIPSQQEICLLYGAINTRIVSWSRQTKSDGTSALLQPQLHLGVWFGRSAPLVVASVIPRLVGGTSVPHMGTMALTANSQHLSRS